MFSNCNEKTCPGWKAALIAGAVMIVMVLGGLISDAYAGEVVVSFERELPNKTVEFQRTFEDKDAFEMWLADRLEGKGCDPYLKNMSIQFNNDVDL